MRVWYCPSCKHVEEAAPPYRVGDTEPCVHCVEGTAMVMVGGKFTPESVERLIKHIRRMECQRHSQ